MGTHFSGAYAIRADISGGGSLQICVCIFFLCPTIWAWNRCVLPSLTIKMFVFTFADIPCWIWNRKPSQHFLLIFSRLSFLSFSFFELNHTPIYFFQKKITQEQEISSKRTLRIGWIATTTIIIQKAEKHASEREWNPHCNGLFAAFVYFRFVFIFSSSSQLEFGFAWCVILCETTGEDDTMKCVLACTYVFICVWYVLIF